MTYFKDYDLELMEIRSQFLKFLKYCLILMKQRFTIQKYPTYQKYVNLYTQYLVWAPLP